MTLRICCCVEEDLVPIQRKNFCLGWWKRTNVSLKNNSWRNVRDILSCDSDVESKRRRNENLRHGRSPQVFAGWKKIYHLWCVQRFLVGGFCCWQWRVMWIKQTRTAGASQVAHHETDVVNRKQHNVTISMLIPSFGWPEEKKRLRPLHGRLEVATNRL